MWRSRCFRRTWGRLPRRGIRRELEITCGLVSGADGGEVGTGYGFLPGVGFVLSVDKIKTAVGIGGSFGQRGCESAEGTADFLTVLQHHGRAMVDGRRDRLVSIGHLPQDFAVGRLLDIVVGKPRNLLMAI